MPHKTALVTGASSGIGNAIAHQLIKDGYTTYVAARSVDRMQDLSAAGAIAIAMDVSDDAQITAAVERILSETGGVDVLVNNAGFALYGAVEDIPINEARYQFEVNLFGLGRLTQLLIPAMRANGSGKIVNISSMGGKMYTPLGAWYHATKHALEGWSDCLRLELAPFGIDVIIIEPGIIDTGFVDVLEGPMMKYSGQGAYGGLVQRLAAASRGSYEAGRASPPQVIADVVSKALRSRRPRTRYAKGALGPLMMFIRKWGGDRLFDRVVMSQVT